jgi:hypothetical protein
MQEAWESGLRAVSDGGGLVQEKIGILHQPLPTNLGGPDHLPGRPGESLVGELVDIHLGDEPVERRNIVHLTAIDRDQERAQISRKSDLAEEPLLIA